MYTTDSELTWSVCVYDRQMRALQRYVAFYGLKLDEEYAQADLAALVARHFDRSLDVQEDDSIAAFVQRLRNGEKSGAKRAGDKERRAADKKRKKSNSRKRQREASASAASGSHASNGGGGGHHSSHSNGSTASGSGSSGGHANGGGHGSSSTVTAHHESERKAPGGGAKSKKPSAAASKKDNENEDNELYCICNLPSYGNMIACDGKKCPNPSQWYHLECVGLADGRHPDTWLCPECDPKGFAAFQSKKKKSKHRSKSPGAK